MSKKSKQVAPFCSVRSDGIIHVARPYANPSEPFAKVKGEDVPDYLAMVDHDLTFESKTDYEKALKAEERRLNLLVRQLAEAKKFLAVVFQGRDGAGKSGAVIRISEALDHDSKLFRSVPIGPPSEEERAHPPQWRFFRDDRMPAYGQVRVYDRSWAEEVLVVRVNKIKPDAVWQKAYALNRTMEWMFEQEGGIVVKIWFDITKAEQKRRFKARAEEKPWKLSASDAEARKKWKHYTKAANEMFLRTSADYAPWFIISSEDKRYSRVHVLKVINEQLEAALGKSAEKDKSAKKENETPKLVRKPKTKKAKADNAKRES
jgi:polyphosphate kinase 2 (PPK2 family)